MYHRYEAKHENAHQDNETEKDNEIKKTSVEIILSYLTTKMHVGSGSMVLQRLGPGLRSLTSEIHSDDNACEMSIKSRIFSDIKNNKQNIKSKMITTARILAWWGTAQVNELSCFF